MVIPPEMQMDQRNVSGDGTLSACISPLQNLHRAKKYNENLDRFIPNRSAMDMDYAHFMLTEGRKKGTENQATATSPSKSAYQKHLAEALNMNRTRILAFKNKPPAPANDPYAVGMFKSCSPQQPQKLIKPRRHVPQSAEKTLDAPEVLDDFYLNLLDWSCNNVLAVALSNTVYIWDASDGTTSELVTFDEEEGLVSSISWAPDGRHIAIGLHSSVVQLWDLVTTRKLRELVCGHHRSRISSLAWNSHLLTTAAADGSILNNDVRVRDHIVGTFRGHQQEVCGLRWSDSGLKLASGGNDNTVFVWDRSSASTTSSTRWLQRFEQHTAAVKALAWCPYQANLLASGGGSGDMSIKFWNIHTGACLNSVDTDSQVSSLIWSTHEKELLSSHGYPENQLVLWKYPSMTKTAQLFGHTSRILHTTQSPDGYRVATLGADETLRFWNAFGTPGTAKPKPKTNREPFSSVTRIR